MTPRWIAALIVFVGLSAASPLRAQVPPAAAGQARECPPTLRIDLRRACLAEIRQEADEALVVARRDATRAIADWNGNLDAAARAEWSKEFNRMLDLWAAFRDRTCAPALIGYQSGAKGDAATAASEACHVAITRVIVADLTNRFGEAIPDLARSSFATGRRGPNRRELIGAEGAQPLCRHPGRGGDYQPLTECYQRQAARVDRDLNAVWAQVLASIRARTSLDAADKAAWTEALRAAQRHWAELRDLACSLEAYETPNRFANSIYSQVTGPCLVVETEARVRALRSTYGLR